MLTHYTQPRASKAVGGLHPGRLDIYYCAVSTQRSPLWTLICTCVRATAKGPPVPRLRASCFDAPLALAWTQD